MSFIIICCIIIVCVLCVANKSTKKHLGINESGKGWYIPNGIVNPGETLLDAAKKQCKEQSLGLNINIKGILRVNCEDDKEACSITLSIKLRVLALAKL